MLNVSIKENSWFNENIIKIIFRNKLIFKHIALVTICLKTVCTHTAAAAAALTQTARGFNSGRELGCSEENNNNNNKT